MKFLFYIRPLTNTFSNIIRALKAVNDHPKHLYGKVTPYLTEGFHLPFSRGATTSTHSYNPEYYRRVCSKEVGRSETGKVKVLL